MKVIEAPNHHYESDKYKIFLGGSIENGKAIEWQKDVIDFLSLKEYSDKLVIYNPRRKDWDSTWKNSSDFAPFKEQVTWELDYQKDISDLNVYYFAENTLSPITLLELGIFMGYTTPVVGMSFDYPRRGNLEITLDKFGYSYNLGLTKFKEAIDRRIKSSLGL